MTHLSSEAERLADSIKASGQFTPLAKLDQAAALLRRIPELEAERDRLLAEVERRFNWMPLPTPTQGSEE